MRVMWRHILLVAIIVISLGIMIALEPVPQWLSYHNFADQRSFWGVPNFWNVVSNIPFLIFGLIGFIFCLQNRQKDAHWSWILFFFGVALVCFGSAYYHWNPNNQTLVWDRLPMTIGFMGVFIALLTEFVSPKIEKYFLCPAIILGFFSVIYWQYVDDLRFYGWVQAIPLLTLPVAFLLFKGHYMHQRYLFFSLFCYLFAKLTEVMDAQIFSLTHEQLSGHTIKHLSAALSVFCLYLMLKRRRRSEIN